MKAASRANSVQLRFQKQFKTGIATLLLLVAAAGCAQTEEEVVDAPVVEGPVVPTPTPTPVATGASLTCSSSLLDAGQKGSVTTVGRGQYSDTKMIPDSTAPATAYSDASAVSIKLAYWNGSSFTNEIVAADGAGAFVRLAFLSNKTPLIFWTLGGSLKVAIRSAPLGSIGVWSAGIIDTGVAPRAVEVSVNPLNQVGVVFLTDTATTGRAKFLYCDAPCASPTGFQTMGTNPYIENTALIAGQVATGAAWCKVSESIYYPVAAYAVTGNTKFAICTNTLANCLNGSSWTNQSVVATGNVSTKVLLDSTVVGDVPKVVALAAAGIVPYRMGTTACGSGLSAFTAGTAMGSATSGNHWMSVMKDGDGKFHVVANESTTSVRYFNSTSTTITGTWNAPAAIETLTLAAAEGGGADINTATQGIYASYGGAALPFDIKLARINDYTQPPSGATFTRFVPDLSGNLQLAAANSQLKQIAVASNSGGYPATAYVDFSVGAASAAKLKFAYRTGLTASSTWVTTLIPGTISPQFPGLVFDDSGLPWVSYFDGSTNRFYLSTNSRSDGTGSWFTYEFPAIPSGAPIALPAANNTAVSLYRHAGQVDIVMAVIDTNATSKGIKAAVFNTVSRSFGAATVIDALLAGALGAAHISMDADANGNIALAYQDLNSTRVKYSVTETGGATWSTPLSLSGIGQGAGAQLRINSASSSPAISYFDQANNTVYLASCSGTLATCATGGWTPSLVEGAAGVNGLAAGSGQLLSTGLQFKDGKAYVFYPRGQGNDGNLIANTNFSGSFAPTVVATGVNASLSGTPALNFGIAGWGVQVAPNSVGSFTGVYLGPGNRLYSVSCGD